MSTFSFLRLPLSVFARGLGACVLLVLFASSLQGVVAADVLYHGEARNEAGALVYTETHQVVLSSGRRAESVTEYRAPDGAMLATLRSDYSRSVLLPTYVFEDFRRNYSEGLRWQDGRYLMFYQKGTSPERTAFLEGGDPLFSCQGWHYYLLENLGALEQQGFILNLVLPSELRPMPFAVRTLSSDESQVSAELHLRHWLLRHFAPTLRLSYDKQKRRLTEFHGVSNILDQSGHRQVLTIRYYYPEG